MEEGSDPQAEQGQAEEGCPGVASRRAGSLRRNTAGRRGRRSTPRGA